MYQRVQGHFVVEDTCRVKSENLTIFPSRVHLAFTVNVTTKQLYPLHILKNITFDRLSYVTNSLQEMSFSNHSEFASVLEESLPEYLNPEIFYPSVLIQILLIIVILIQLLCCVKKALSLYKTLRIARKNQQ